MDQISDRHGYPTALKVIENHLMLLERRDSILLFIFDSFHSLSFLFILVFSLIHLPMESGTDEIRNRWNPEPMKSGTDGIRNRWNPEPMESGTDGIRIRWNPEPMESGTDGIRIRWNPEPQIKNFSLTWMCLQHRPYYSGHLGPGATPAHLQAPTL